MSIADSEKKPKVILFGAGKAGVAAKRNLADRYEFVAFCDNDANKVHQILDDLLVISPASLADTVYDLILVASEFAEQITKQLIKEHRIDQHKVFAVNWADLKPVTLGENNETEQFAINLLHKVCAQLGQAQVRYYVDAGTLLGIYRDNRLIPWDDDLDIAVVSSDIHATITAIEALLPELESQTHTTWQLLSLHTHCGFGNVPKGAIRSLKLSTENDSLSLPMVDIFIKYVGTEWMDYCLASRGIRMPSLHINHLDSIVFAGQSLNIPSRVEDYLERHYGDWRTPKKEWGLGDLTNATVF